MMKKISLSFLFLFLGFFFGPGIAIADLQDFAKIRVHPELQKQLQTIVESGIRRAFGDPVEKLPPPAFVFAKPQAVFVTFQSGDQVRGCMGNLTPRQANLQEEILRQINLALFHDPRHSRIQREELAGVKVFVTAVGTPFPVRSMEEVSPARDAVVLRYGSKEAVALPGEAKTQRYLLGFLKAKAGIRKGERFQLYRLPVETVQVELAGFKNIGVP